VPIFVLIHHPPSDAPKQDEHLTFTFVTDGVESAVAQAKAAARDKAVQVVGGVSIARQLLDAGLVDELHVDIMPLFLGIALQSFESCSLERVRLEKIKVQEVGARTSLRFRVKQELTFWADFAERVGEGEIDFVVGEALSLTGEILLFGSGGEGGQLARGLQRALINCGGGLGGGVLFGSGGRAARCELSVRNTPRTVARTSTSSTATVIHWRAFIGWSGVVPS
jgi:hypothetical protein